MVFNKIKESILERSGSFKFYKENYDKVVKNYEDVVKNYEKMQENYEKVVVDNQKLSEEKQLLLKELHLKNEELEKFNELNTSLNQLLSDIKDIKTHNSSVDDSLNIIDKKIDSNKIHTENCIDKIKFTQFCYEK
jgi:cell fate (sporulation/competence/biofilm development) regulator YlbF (YheA/YmcA/DUF963 family)